jgi:hypothetical protein
MRGAIPPLSQHAFKAWCSVKKKDRDSFTFYIYIVGKLPRVVTEEKNSPTVAHACRKRRLKWVLPRFGVGAQG